MENSDLRARATRALCLSLPAVTAALLWACSAKDPGFFTPVFADPSSLPDKDAPRPYDFFPLRTLVGPQHIDGIRVSLDDPRGTNGAEASGVDPASVKAVINGSMNLSLSSMGHTWSGDFGNIPDGNVDLALSASDLAGNDTTVTYSFLLKRTPPDVQFTSLPPLAQSSDQDSSEVHVAGTVIDGYIANVYGGIYGAGADGVCGTADDELWPKGSGPGQVSENYWGYYVGQTGGSFGYTTWFHNPVQVGGSDLTSDYCIRAYADDSAGDGLGGSNPNYTIAGVPAQISWTRTPTTGDVFGTVTLDGSPWQGVTVAAGTAWSGQTDAQGNYRIGGLAPGTYTVAPSSIPQDVVCTPPWASPQVQAGQDTRADFSCVTKPQFSIQLTPSYRHFTTSSEVCVIINTSPAQSGASYTLTITGPAVDGTGVHTGMLDTLGAAQVSNPIFAYGTYIFDVLIGDNSANASVIVDGTPGSCSF